MSVEQKVALAKEARSAVGLAPALAVLELPRSTWYYHQKQRVSYPERYRYLREPLEAIARAHPEYGYRRTTVELREVYGHPVNHKVVQRLHQAWDLPLLRGTRRPRPGGIRQAITAVGTRANLVAGRAVTRPFEVVYADFSELVYADGKRRAHLIPLLDHASKSVLGWAVGERADTVIALQAWQQARHTLAQRGIAMGGMIVHHDQAPVFTGYGWTAQLLLGDKVRLSYALNGAKDNPEMEAFLSRFKTENHSLFLEVQTLKDLISLVGERMDYYNHERRHSTIGYVSPSTYLETGPPCR